MKDILNFVLAIFTILLIPVFMIAYFFYGFRIWCWYFNHAPPFDGDWSIRTPDVLKTIKLKRSS